MPLTRKQQILAKDETIPGTEQTTFVAADATDVLEAEFSQTRAMLERIPASSTLSRFVEATGRGSGTLTFGVDAKGSGLAITAPDWGRHLQAASMKAANIPNLQLAAALTKTVYAGDLLVAADGAAMVCLKTTASGSALIPVFVEGTNPGTGLAVLSLNYGSTSIGTTHAVTPITGNVGWSYNPISDQELQFTTTAAWGAPAPVPGEVIVVTAAGIQVGALIVTTAPSGSTTFAEHVWGLIPASATLSATGGGTATVAAVPAITQVRGKSLTLRHNRDRLARTIYGARGNVGLSAEAGGHGTFHFTFTGKAGTVTDAAFVPGAVFATTVPPRLQGGIVVVNGLQIPVRSVEFQAGNEVIMHGDANATEGDLRAEIVARDPQVVLVLDQVGKTSFDWWSTWSASGTVTLGIQFGTAGGNTITIAASKAQVSEFSDAEEDGIATHSVTLKLRALDPDADDEYVIAHV
jgi:hypothetical protein